MNSCATLACRSLLWLHVQCTMYFLYLPIPLRSKKLMLSRSNSPVLLFSKWGVKAEPRTEEGKTKVTIHTFFCCIIYQNCQQKTYQPCKLFCLSYPTGLDTYFESIWASDPQNALAQPSSHSPKYLPPPPPILCDQFTGEHALIRALEKFGKTIYLQRHPACGRPRIITSTKNTIQRP